MDVLFPIIRIQHIPPNILSHIIFTAYQRSSLRPESLCILESDSEIEEYASPAMHLYDCYEKSAFHGKHIDDVVRILREGVTGNVVAANLFYIADDQTIRDHTLLLVQVQGEGNDTCVLSVRLAPEFANGMAISIYDPESHIKIQDIQKDVDDDGVFRGGRDTPYKYVGTPSYYLSLPETPEQGN
ncbi:hypothetical protein PEX1_056800 [Penicillium expansum]|nr:hypothetical protein N7453_004623 [Penicillium expansum]KGO37862.1 hypothetical protein PEXP_078780 [Penicillium expansum]KGO42054.1 hypothetical protein PEX1_056800 [Penicillium expansum]